MIYKYSKGYFEVIEMIKIKSILDKKSEKDGSRICVMRFVKDFYDYDEWLRELAPSIELLNDSRKKKIDWNGYVERYLREMDNKKELIEKLKGRSDKGEIITLLCWEKDDRFCHRRLLKELIERLILFDLSVVKSLSKTR